MKTEEIYHDECCCLYANNVRSDECRKRYYVVYDVDEDKKKEIIVCNEYLRRRVDEEMHKTTNDTYEYVRGYVNPVLEDIIGNYVDISTTCIDYGICGDTTHDNLRKNDLFDHIIWVKVCERPFIGKAISFSVAMEHAYNGNKKMQKAVYKVIELYLNRYESLFGKYKTKYAQTHKILRDLKRYYFIGNHRAVLTNELFNNLLQMKIKEKQLLLTNHKNRKL